MSSWKQKKLDPLSPIIGSNIGDSLFFLGCFKEAADQFRRLLENYPDFAYAQTRLGLVLLNLSEYEEAIEHIKLARELSKEYTGSIPDLILACAMSGRKAEAEKLVTELESRASEKYLTMTDLALANAAVGRNDRAIYWLQQSVA